MSNTSYKDCLTGLGEFIDQIAVVAAYSNTPEMLKQAANKIEEIADELIDANIKSAIRISKLEQELARIKGLTMEYS